MKLTKRVADVARKKKTRKPPKSKPAPSKEKREPALISLRAYAQHRGCSAEAVRRAIQSGRLAQSVTINARNQPKITDTELADREWEANTRRPKTPPKPRPPAPEAKDEAIEYAEARRRREVELWRQSRVKCETDLLDLAKKKGELINVDEARAAVVEVFSRVRTKLLGLPSRCRQRLPELSTADVGVIDDMVREALEELADDE